MRRPEFFPPYEKTGPWEPSPPFTPAAGAFFWARTSNGLLPEAKMTRERIKMTDNLASAVGELEGTIDVLDMKLAELQKKHSLED